MRNSHFKIASHLKAANRYLKETHSVNSSDMSSV